jgi:hypothetical protein
MSRAVWTPTTAFRAVIAAVHGPNKQEREAGEGGGLPILGPSNVDR